MFSILFYGSVLTHLALFGKLSFFKFVSSLGGWMLKIWKMKVHQGFDPIVHTGQLGCYRLYLKLSFACRQQSLATSPSTPLFNSCKELQIVQVLTNILNSSDLKNIHNYTSIYTRSLYNANSLSAKFNMCLLIWMHVSF